MWNFAESYLQAGDAVAKVRLRFDAPMYYLYSHAMELALKAYLLAAGLSVRALAAKNFGHRLPALLTKARELGLVEGERGPSNHAVIQMLGPYNAVHDFRYIRTGFMRLPELEEVRKTVASLLEASRATCFASLKAARK